MTFPKTVSLKSVSLFAINGGMETNTWTWYPQHRMRKIGYKWVWTIQWKFIQYGTHLTNSET